MKIFKYSGCYKILGLLTNTLINKMLGGSRNTGRAKKYSYIGPHTSARNTLWQRKLLVRPLYIAVFSNVKIEYLSAKKKYSFY